MSLTNSSVLSCLATAVGCTMTSIAVSDQLDTPSPFLENPTGSHQNRPKTAQELMAEASEGVDQGIAPPEIAPLEIVPLGQTPTTQQPNTPTPPHRGNTSSSEPASSTNHDTTITLARYPLRLPAPPQFSVPQIEQLREFLPDYLNSDNSVPSPREPQPSEALPEFDRPELATQEFESVEVATGSTVQPNLMPPVNSTLESTPLPPPPALGQEQIAAQYVVEPQTLASRNPSLEAANSVSDEVRANRYVVNPDSPTQTTPRPENSGQSTLPLPQRTPSQEFIVQPEDSPALQPPSSVNPKLQPSQPETSAVQPQPMPSLLKTLTEPYELAEDLEQPEDSPALQPPSSVNLKLQPSQPETSAIQPQPTPSQPETSAVQAQPMPSLLKTLTEPYELADDLEQPEASPALQPPSSVNPQLQPSQPETSAVELQPMPSLLKTLTEP